jgi:hypothetical protein
MNAFNTQCLFLLRSILTAPELKVHPYLDPGSGSFILQILLATLLASLFFLRSFWKKALDFLRGNSSKSTHIDPALEDEMEEK